jgi:hypothetical protein
MNTIPAIFSHALPPYTAVGGTKRLGSAGLSAVLLNRRGLFFRRGVFQELEKAGFDYVVSIESAPERYDVEDLSSRFPFVRFVLVPEGLNLGEQINLGAVELSSPLFFVLWNDLKIIIGGGADRMAERLYLPAEELKKAGAGASQFRRLCTVPWLLNNRFETHPSLAAPSAYKKNMRTLFFAPRQEGLPSLYPFDGVGIYDRERFISLGGFDPLIRNPHWQLMDFGFRARLWGEEISATQYIKLSSEGLIPAEDSTVDEGYRRFYLKNIAPVFREEEAHLPWRRFPSYLASSGWDLFGAWEDFKSARRWVRDNGKRWKRDARTVNDSWEDMDPPPGEA